jgi:hypothetical protein
MSVPFDYKVGYSRVMIVICVQGENDVTSGSSSHTGDEDTVTVTCLSDLTRELLSVFILAFW